MECKHCPQVRPVFRMPVRANRGRRETWARSGVTFICPSRWMKARVETAIPGALAFHVPNPVDDEYLAAPPKYSLQNRDLADCEGVTVVGLIAADWRDPRKRGSALSEILSGLRRDQVIFRIAGHGGEAVFPRDPRIQLVGALANSNEIIDFLSACDLNLHLAEADNLPNTLVEAMAVGVPNLAVRSGGVGDAVIHLETGLLADSVRQVPSLLDFAIRENKMRDQWSITSKRYAKATFSASVVSKRITEIYQQSLERVQ